MTKKKPRSWVSDVVKGDDGKLIYRHKCEVQEFSTDEFLLMCGEGHRDKFPHIIYFPVKKEVEQK